MGRVDRGGGQLLLSGFFEEYRALYDLVVFRMTALDRRAPVTAGALITAVATLNAFPAATQNIVLLSVPAAVLWFVRTTVNHARSFEDVLRRIEEIERAVNKITGHRVMCFQSSHPSRGHKTGGRTGQETVAAVMTTAAVLLVVAGYRMTQNADFPIIGKLIYFGLLALIGGLCVREVILVKKYRYAPQGIEPTDPSQPLRTI